METDISTRIIASIPIIFTRLTNCVSYNIHRNIPFVHQIEIKIPPYPGAGTAILTAALRSENFQGLGRSVELILIQFLQKAVTTELTAQSRIFLTAGTGISAGGEEVCGACLHRQAEIPEISG